MIGENKFISYAQNLEDVMLWRALKHIKTGFYIDIGACDPEKLSVTKAFYDRGWCGINIEPTIEFSEKLKKERPMDINLQVAAGDHDGEINLYEIQGTGLSTTDQKILERAVAEYGLRYNKISVPVKKLDSILEGREKQVIHFLKIDVEGAEKEVIDGIDLNKIRPWIIIVESTTPNTRENNHYLWEAKLLASNYTYVYFDGLNRFYISMERNNLLESFKEPPNIYDNYITFDHYCAINNLTSLQNDMKSYKKALEDDLKQLKQAYEDEKNKKILKRILDHAKHVIIKLLDNAVNYYQKGIIQPRDYWMKLGVYFQYNPKKVLIRPPKYKKRKNYKLPSIAIVTPSYNQGIFLEAAISSVLNQNYENISYAVIDGGSADCSIDVIKKHRNKLAYAVSEPDLGQSHAIVKGFNQVEGEIMGYLNSDDILLPGSLEYIGRYFADNPNVDVLYGNRLIIDKEGFEVGRWILPEHCTETLRRVDWIPQENMFWRKHIYDEVGGIDPQYKFAMDWDLILRFMKAGARFAHVQQFFACFRAHDSQKSQTEYETTGIKEVRHLRIRELGENEKDWNIEKWNNKYIKKSIYCSMLLE